MKRSISGWMLIFILSTVILSFGQTASTSLRGVVKDPTGALVPGAKITIVDAAKGATFTATANSTGSYTFAQISRHRSTRLRLRRRVLASSPRPQNSW